MNRIKPRNYGSQISDAILWSTVKFAAIVSILFNIVQYFN